MPYFSMIMVAANNKTAKETAQIWIDRPCIEETAETIPGFQRGEVLVQDDADNKICVLCVWNEKSDYDAWLKSPVRDKQGEDIGYGLPSTKNPTIGSFMRIAYMQP